VSQKCEVKKALEEDHLENQVCESKVWNRGSGSYGEDAF
jgi:hypothetical protein